ncbi:MAG: 3-oxoacyl-[acyl-carrier-protein] synthase 3 [Chlamydiales bacterium]|nr:3-oxoacyl-[acyl-carrier-protein] synthase 3 [Chlamydiales bacterium]
MKKPRIIGMGSYLPEKTLSNHDLEKMVETSDEWIASRTGIKERRIAGPEEFTSDMGVKAARIALKEAGKRADEIDLILVATLTPDYIFPSTAALIQSELKAPQAAAFDFQAACTGYLYGLSIAKGYIEAGLYRNILLIASEKLSSIVNYKDRNTCILFGDGAAAAVISDSGEGYAIQEVCLGADGEVAKLLMLPAGGCRAPASHETIENDGHFIKMEGKEVFKHAVRRMENAAKECLIKAGMKADQIDWLVPHQANERIIDAIAKRFGIADEKIFKTVHKYGNTSASAISIALDELVREKQINQGENMLLVAFGAGFTWGAAILTRQE